MEFSIYYLMLNLLYQKKYNFDELSLFPLQNYHLMIEIYIKKKEALINFEIYIKDGQKNFRSILLLKLFKILRRESIRRFKRAYI